MQAGRVVAATGFIVLLLLTALPVSSSTFFEPFNVSYDHRALIIDGERRMLTSAGIHYPRATPEMWSDLIAKSKEGGADVIQSYVFWNGHEPQRGQYYFEGRYDLVKFVKLVGLSGMYFHLRIGPYVCAEWNFGGFPVWLRDIPGVEFRTDNAPFKEEMERFVRKIVDLMREEMLFSWQGGPIIMLQIENEYGNIESSYGEGGKEYVKWAASMALGLDARVPWIMCRQADAPEAIINSCNDYYCDGFKPNSYGKPVFWTEDWDGWYASWGGRLPHRPVEDLAFAIARFFQRGGSFQNYYMGCANANRHYAGHESNHRKNLEFKFFGGTNFGRTSGGPFLITSYDYDAPIDEYGLLSQPKWGHLKDLHAAIKLCSRALVASDSPQYIKLGPMQEAHVYYVNNHLQGLNSTTYYTSDGSCSAFLANIDEHRAVTVQFHGRAYTLPPWSVSILPDCVNVVFNSAKVSAQTSVKPIAAESPLQFNLSLRSQTGKQNELSAFAEPWMYLQEPINVWSEHNFTVKGFLEHLNVTKDTSDYLWHFTRVYVSDEDITYWEENGISPTIAIDSIRDVLRVFVNGELSADTFGRWVKAVLPINLSKGYNDLVLLSQTVGLQWDYLSQNYGAFLERDGAGFRGQAKLTGFKKGDINLLELSWTYQVGLKGEFKKVYSGEEISDMGWTRVMDIDSKSAFSWYKNYFDSPEGDTPVALDLASMGKGQAWVNGHHIGRYWTLVAPKDGCQEKCDYRGAYHSEKCQWNCGRPTQSRYHIPRSWLQDSDNLLVIFEETGGNPSEISIKLHTSEVICSQVSETHYPPLSRWYLLDSTTGGAISVDNPTPEVHLQCENGHMISSIEFASYGTPMGSCQNFGKSSCHAPSSLQVVREACQGRNGCSVSVSNARFGSDPCHGIVKTLAVQARCVPSSKGLETASM